MGRTIRDTHKYVFRVGSKIATYGVTNNLTRRENELRNTHGSGRIHQIGRKISRQGALEWRREQF
jgi:hypothetical protein